jgi:hypothetical protein
MEQLIEIVLASTIMMVIFAAWGVLVSGLGEIIEEKK